MHARISHAVLMLLITALTGVCAIAEELKDGWSIKLGGGIATSPRYEGSRDSYTSFEPVLDIAYKNGSLLIAPGAVIWTPLESGIFSLGGVITYNLGRNDKSSHTQFEPGSDSLKGMGNIKGTFEAGIIARAGPASLIVRKAPAGRGHGGGVAEFAVDIPFEINDRFSITITPGIAWMDRRYAQSFFGVTALQSADSGKPVFTAQRGFKSMGLVMSAEYKITDNWSVDAMAGVSYLHRNITKSPIVEKRGQVSATLTVNYTF